MPFAIITIIAGATIRPLFPTGLLYLIGVTTVALAIGIPSRIANLRLLGETVHLDAATIALGFVSTFAMHAVLFLIAWGIALLVRRRRGSNTAASDRLAD